MSRSIFKAVAIAIAVAWCGAEPASGFQRPGGRAPIKGQTKPKVAEAYGVETSSNAEFTPQAFPKLAVIIASEKPRATMQGNQQRLIEDEFFRVLISKGYVVVSRADVETLAKEQGFQKSGMTSEADAAKIGKILNVPAVLLVRISEATARRTEAKVSLGAKLVGVANGSILWIGTLDVTKVVANDGDLSIVIADVAKRVANAFPTLSEAKPEAEHAAGVEVSSDPSFNPKKIVRMAVVMSGANVRTPQSDQQHIVEGEFVRTLIAKGYSIASRSDLATVVKEQAFQKSGITEDNAVEMGKLLNVPAVMVVRITDSAVEQQRDPRSGRPAIFARVSIGARLMSVETGQVLWTANRIESNTVNGKGDASKALSIVSRSIVDAFPDKTPTVKDPKAQPKPAADASFHPAEIKRLAVVVVDSKHRAEKFDQQRIVEDEFLKVLLRKQYSLVTRDDVQAIAKEKQFQKSGLTEDNAASLGKLLNVPAVLVVRVTDIGAEQIDIKGRPPIHYARASICARLVSVETGLVLWAASHIETSTNDPSDLAKLVVQACKSVAVDFPDRNAAK